MATEIDSEELTYTSMQQGKLLHVQFIITPNPSHPTACVGMLQYVAILQSCRVKIYVFPQVGQKGPYQQNNNDLAPTCRHIRVVLGPDIISAKGTEPRFDKLDGLMVNNFLH